MIKQGLTFTLLAAALLGLVACGEKPQEMHQGSGVKHDAGAYSGVGNSQYAQPGWKAGDKGSWEQQLKARAQYGQNDYTRVSAQPQSR